MNEEIKEFDPNKDVAWYAVGCLTGRDFKVNEALSAKMKNGKWTNEFFDVLLPVQKEIKVRKLKSGIEKKTEKDLTIYTGYIFVQCIMTDELWFEIRNTPGVSGIIGSYGKGSKPQALSKEEITHILNVAGRELDPSEMPTYTIGDSVCLTSGPFAGQVGKLTAITPDLNTVEMELDLFNKIVKLSTSISSITKK